MIKELGIEDYPKIQALWKVAGLSWRPEGRDNIDRIREQIKSKNVFFLGKIENGELIGVILITHDTRKGWINRLAVLPQYRNRGVAQQLIKEAEDRLYQVNGIEVISTLIFDDNEASTSLFEKVGYESWTGIQYYSKRLRPDA
ncbi:MAG: GNAT family N-acetyltransferase [Candidatus Hodarchaeales archaeon]